ncbi:acyl-CoA N-acyltransferase [Aspergillus brunneoviolaceus CBS 621.78]|uniref:Acyl-CoA N-acyltransferase n=1 Tax=Aspergillus brunneoviolaceus CBS 621.78 TaxID=1450534 RepID=A0ACD1GBT5_9EURO|nr:acyl-CoA N-acyltransferase [Aspergillus brunneoviolaceus CBS 621.78]RAH46594.1 acyl-CoA N-acyltransferase [Aspergillus brunneoviolaceus CBS 621.78]
MTAAGTIRVPQKDGSPLRLEFATIDDLNEITDLWYNAFSPGMLFLWPDTPGVRQWWNEANRHDMLHKPNAKYLKVVDTAQNGRIVAYAKWSLETAEERGPRWPAWHSEMDPALMDKFLGHLETNRATAVAGAPKNFYLDMLATHSDYRKRGAARLLLEWGCEVGDEENAHIYIDASTDGQPVYQKFGFVSKNDPLVDPFEVAAMVRHPGWKSV